MVCGPTAVHRGRARHGPEVQVCSAPQMRHRAAVTESAARARHTTGTQDLSTPAPQGAWQHPNHTLVSYLTQVRTPAADRRMTAVGSWSLQRSACEVVAVARARPRDRPRQPPPASCARKSSSSAVRSRARRRRRAFNGSWSRGQAPRLGKFGENRAQCCIFQRCQNVVPVSRYGAGA